MHKSFAESQVQSQTTRDYKLGNLHQPFNRYVDFEDCALKLELHNGICTLTRHKFDLLAHLHLYIPEVQLSPAFNPGIVCGNR